MNILFITSGWPPESVGGVEVYSRRLAVELSKRHTVRVFCREADRNRPDYSVRSDADGPIPVTRVNYNYGDFADFTGTYFIEPMGHVFGQFLTETGLPDVAHVHHLGSLGHLLIDVLAKLSAPIVLTQHDFALTCPRGQRIRDDYSICDSLTVSQCLDCLRPQCHGNRSAAWKLYRYLFRKQLGRDMMNDFWTSSEKVANRAGAILAPSEFHAKKLADDGFPREKIRVMPYGYDVARFAESRRGKIGKARKFGYLGSLIPSKGVHVLVEAFGLLAKDLPDLPLELHLHGPAPAYHGRSDYPAVLRQLAGVNKVTFHGKYDNEQLPGILGSLDALVMPSLWWETHGMVIREAKLAGLPVIVSDLGAMAEAVVDGVNGLKVRPGNPKALRDKMRILAITPGLADTIASNPMAVKTIEEDARDHEKLYSSLVADKQS